ncbi:MAG: hypothetical protein DRQ55_10835 [Planctomycetota bacterium]|nr:MAG: hypothetical protein DRQ55_10835 [Planctomycetota bacterium]
MLRTSFLLTVALLIALLGCAGDLSLDQSVDELQASFNSKDFEGVVSAAGPLLQRAQGEGAEASQCFRIEKLRVSALARQGQGTAATEHLERLAGEYSAQVNAKLYNQMGSYVEELSLLEAIAVYDAGAKRFPANADDFKPRIEALKVKAEATGDADALASLKSLGYL